MIDALDAYRRTLTSLENGSETAWWYLGTTMATAEGHPEFPLQHVETVMVYGAQDLDDGQAYRVPWWEIGVFRDVATGALPTQWINPVTGLSSPAPRQFEEGPSGYTIRRRATGGVEMVDAVQAFASLESVTIDVRTIGEKVCITQTEHKTRSFPGPDGRIPDISEGKAVRSRTVLQWLADLADLQSDAPSVPASGMYTFDLEAAPQWAGFADLPTRFGVRGIMRKAPMHAPLHASGWENLMAVYPQYFEDGRIRPRWTR